MYYENFELLCNQNNVKPSQVSKATNISTATLTSWKQGKYTPKQDKLQLIADFFDVSVDYLMTGKETKHNFDYLYTSENAELLIEVSKMAKDAKFAERMLAYMRLMSKHQEHINDMIDFYTEKEKNGEV